MPDGAAGAAPSGSFDFPDAGLPVRLAGRRCREETGLREDGGGGAGIMQTGWAGKAACRCAGRLLWPIFILQVVDVSLNVGRMLIKFTFTYFVPCAFFLVDCMYTDTLGVCPGHLPLLILAISLLTDEEPTSGRHDQNNRKSVKKCTVNFFTTRLNCRKNRYIFL